MASAISNGALIHDFLKIAMSEPVACRMSRKRVDESENTNFEAQNAKFGLKTLFDGLGEPVWEVQTLKALRTTPFGKSGHWAPQARPDGPGERVPHL